MKKRLILGSMLTLLIGIVVLIGVTVYYGGLPQRVSRHETVILGQGWFIPGRDSALRVVVRDSQTEQPIPGAAVNIALRSSQGSLTPLFSGSADAQGKLDPAFRVPDTPDAKATLVIETASKLGKDVIERDVIIARDYKVLLTTDKPIYQPGQVIHMRCLALSAFDRLPDVGASLELTVADGKGNKVFRQALVTSEFGVASADFQLASEVNSGNYKISASLNGTTSEKTVKVEPYVLPKFGLTLTSDRSYYQPGQHAQATISAQYFYGKPVSGGAVTLEGYTFDVERSSVFSAQGTTDAQGNLTLDFDIPAYLAGSDLEQGNGRFYLQASVTDRARHTETSNLSLPVAQQALVIRAMPEDGRLASNLENIIYVLTTYPDGTPAPASLTAGFGPNAQVSAESGPYGLAEIHITPTYGSAPFQVTARDAQGNQAQQEFRFQPDYGSLLLRPDRPVYRTGDTMQLTILTGSGAGTVYLDLVRDGQTLSTRAVDAREGRADVAVDVTPDMAGTLELHAYQLLADESARLATRRVVVDSASELNITLSPEKETYQPGDQARVNIQVSGQDGAGVHSALGLAIVDESVFALADQDAGFAKLYFMLEKELLTPKYDIHGFSIPNMVSEDAPEPDPQLRQAYEGAAFASLASLGAVNPSRPLFSLSGSSHRDAMVKAVGQREAFFTPLSTGMIIAAILCALLIAGLAILILVQHKRFGASVGILAAAGAGLVVLTLIWAGFGVLGLVLVLILAFIGFWVLLGEAAAQGDALLGLALGAITAYVILVILIIVSASWARFDSDLSDLLLFSMPVVLGALVLLIVGLVFKPAKPNPPASASLLLLLIFLVGCAPAASLFKGSMNPMALAPGAVPTQASETAQAKDAQTNDAAAPRLRQYFPETLLWLPDAVTQPDGSLQVDFPVADSITTWRMTALASSKDGRIGSATGSLRVFQDFFVDIDLPQHLTVGDEIAVPVGVYNYLPSAQTVRLEVSQEGWFELLDEPSKAVTIQANDIQVVYFRVRASQFGPNQPFTVTATGSERSDAIRRSVQVSPNGKQISFAQSDRLPAGQVITPAVKIPADAIPGTQKMLVKLYPGILSQVVEGLDSILRMPSGCFEQTSSTTYPNILVLDYLKSSGQAAPEVQMQAEQYINVGYQRLTTFEVAGGGFSLFGRSPADRMLTAYGLQEFSDMRRVHPVDEALVQRTANWLLAQQTGDGSWEPDKGMYHEAGTWQNLRNTHLPTTAYIVWSLIDAGFGSDERVQKGLAYLQAHQSEAEDPYVLGLVANALVAGDAAGSQAVLDRLAAQAQRDGEDAYWTSGVATFMGSQGQTASIETTALAALALLRGSSHPEVANGALLYLVRQKDSFGTWYSTQSTIWTLKALIASLKAGSERAEASITIRLNGRPAKTVEFTPQTAGVMQMVSMDDLNPGGNTLEIEMTGEGNLMYQVSGSYYLPWESAGAPVSDVPDLMTLKVAYDRAQLRVDDTVQVSVSAQLNGENATAQSALIDLGLPPGFSPLTEDLDALVAASQDRAEGDTGPAIERYELAGRQILIYVTHLRSDTPLSFSYRLRARFPLRVSTPQSSLYDYYNPQVNGQTPPQAIEVKE